MENSNLVELSNIIKKYEEKVVINNLTMAIKKNHIYGLLGENGSGKTTLLKIIADLIEYNGGTISFSNKDSVIGLVLDDNGLYDQYSVWFNLEFFARLHGVYNKEYVKKYLRMVNLEEYKKIIISKLSKGLKRRVVLARALMIKPNLLLLDEPYDGLDINSRTIISKCIREWVKEGDNSAIFVSHNVDEIIDLCDSVGIMKKGKILFERDLSNIERMKFKHLEIVGRNPGDIKVLLDNKNIDYKKREDKFEIHLNESDADVLIDEIQNNQISIREISKKYLNLKEIYLKVYEE